MKTLIDGDDSRVAYSGTWSKDSCPLTNSSYNGSAKESNTTGNYVEFNFYGDAINAVSWVWNNMGKADVYIDNVLDSTIDLYSSTEYFQKVVYSKTGLALGNHTIKIVVKGTKMQARRVIPLISMRLNLTPTELKRKMQDFLVELKVKVLQMLQIVKI